MRILTKKDREYLERLNQRNFQLIKQSAYDKTRELWYQGLSNPMTSNERKMRERIRKKAIAAMFDLALVSRAGVLPDRKLLKQGVNSVVGMLEDIGTHMMIKNIQKAKKLVGSSEQGL